MLRYNTVMSGISTDLPNSLTTQGGCMNGNIRIGSLFGIPFYVNPSWFFVLILVTWLYGSGLASDFPGLTPGIAGGLGLVVALLLFASVLAHELGHSLVALRQGIGVQSITLFLFGGLASLEAESTTPAETFWVAIAGPLVSLGLSALFTGLSWVTAATGPLGEMIHVLANINLALAVFNLIPGLPLDGGNILKAVVWQVTGSPYKGVLVASRMGQVVGWVAILSGLLPVLLGGNFGGLWNLLIGSFVLQNAGRSAEVARMQQRCAGLTAADAVIPDGPVVSAQLDLRAFADRCILAGDAWRKFLVTNREGQLMGEIDIESLSTVPRDRWSETPVETLVKPINNLTTVLSDQPLWNVMQQLETAKVTALPVIQPNGSLVGLLEKSAIVRLLQDRLQVA
jgi:Zn-dependent protease/CBS domain-containing protein